MVFLHQESKDVWSHKPARAHSKAHTPWRPPRRALALAQVPAIPRSRRSWTPLRHPEGRVTAFASSRPPRVRSTVPGRQVPVVPFLLVFLRLPLESVLLFIFLKGFFVFLPSFWVLFFDLVLIEGFSTIPVEGTERSDKDSPKRGPIAAIQVLLWISGCIDQGNLAEYGRARRPQTPRQSA